MKIQMLKPAAIKVGERFRSDVGDVEELAADIMTNGLLHPIVVDEEFNLIAGGRRLVALTMLEWVTIPCHVVEVGSEHKRRVLELAENIQRKQLTWQEEIKLKAEITRLMEAQHGSVKDGIKSGWSQAKTAAVLGESPANTGRDLKLAEAMEVLPELADSKTKADALKRLLKLEEDLALAERARRAKAAQRDFNINELVDMYCEGDAFVGMKLEPDESFNFAEVDPPYAIDLGHVRQGEMKKNYTEIDRKDYPAFLSALAKEVYRLLKPDSWCIWWFGPTWWVAVDSALKEAGFILDEIPAIWSKPQGQTNHPGRYLARCWEGFRIARKGDPRLAKEGIGNVFHFASPSSHARIHDAERPLEMMLLLLSIFSMPGYNVLVPFLGSGNTLLAAFKSGMLGKGWNLEDDSCKANFTLRVEAMMEERS